MHCSTRRRWCRSLILGPAALALLGSGAARPEVPAELRRRILFVFTPNGTIPDAFFPSGSETEFVLGPILRPLEHHRSELLVLDGLDLGVAELAAGDEHQKGMAALLTGQPTASGSFCGGEGGCGSGRSGWAAGRSIDQELAVQMRAPTPLPSLELGVRVEGQTNRHRLSYAGPERPLVPDDDPRSVFARLFGGDARDDRRRTAVLDFAMTEVDALRGRSREGLAEADAHLEALETIRTGFSRLEAIRGCTTADRPPSDLDPDDVDAYPLVAALQRELAVEALRCDGTRVVSLLYSGATAKVVPRFVDRDDEAPFDSAITKEFHAYTHERWQDPSDPRQGETRNKLIATYRWYAAELAGLLDRLAEALDVDGVPLLHRTIVVWASELGSPDTHALTRVPFVVAGGREFLRTGRCLRLPGEQHTALLATLAAAMGVDVPVFGHPDFARGPIEELLVG